MIDLAAGKDVEFENFDNTTAGYAKAANRIDELNGSDEQYIYAMKDVADGYGERRTVIARRLKDTKHPSKKLLLRRPY